MRQHINNVPDYALERNYIVARLVDGELWFWGAWNDRESAIQAAGEIGGMVVQGYGFHLF